MDENKVVSMSLSTAVCVLVMLVLVVGVAFLAYSNLNLRADIDDLNADLRELRGEQEQESTGEPAVTPPSSNRETNQNNEGERQPSTFHVRRSLAGGEWLPNEGYTSFEFFADGTFISFGGEIDVETGRGTYTVSEEEPGIYIITLEETRASREIVFRYVYGRNRLDDADVPVLWWFRM
ncbi:MAG: hypothetical protein FWC79_08125 [Oscillospiraceae bacterium]|nr:hypothetical protein [Oscillospiraceae bacterium]